MYRNAIIVKTKKAAAYATILVSQFVEHGRLRPYHSMRPHNSMSALTLSDAESASQFVIAQKQNFEMRAAYYNFDEHGKHAKHRPSHDAHHDIIMILRVNISLQGVIPPFRPNEGRPSYSIHWRVGFEWHASRIFLTDNGETSHYLRPQIRHIGDAIIATRSGYNAPKKIRI